MNAKVILLSASKFDFKDDKTGRELKGTTVHYITLDSKEEDNKVGMSPSKTTLPVEAFDSLSKLKFPQYAEAMIEIDLSSTKQLKVTGFKPTKELTIA